MWSSHGSSGPSLLSYKMLFMSMVGLVVRLLRTTLLFLVPLPLWSYSCFGFACYLNLSSTASHKLAPHSIHCVFLGYTLDHKGYQCIVLATNRLLISRHAIFANMDFPFSTPSHSTANSLPELDFLHDPTTPSRPLPFVISLEGPLAPAYNTGAPGNTTPLWLA